MSRTLIITKEAEADILHGYLSYEEKQDGLGRRFMDEIELACGRILPNPFLYQEVEPDIRRAVTHKFPYLVFFRRADRTGPRGHPWHSGSYLYQPATWCLTTAHLHLPMDLPAPAI